MTKQSEISANSADSLPARSRQLQAIESRTQCQPDSQLTPFTRDTHQGITIRWWDSLPSPGTAVFGGGVVLTISNGHSANYLTGAVAAGRENYYTGAVAAGPLVQQGRQGTGSGG